MFSLIGFLVVLAFFPSALALREWRLWWNLRRNAAECPVQVQYQWIGKIGITPHYYIIYEFEAEDEKGEYFFLSHYTEVERHIYREIEAGQTLHVRYARHNPRLFRLEGQAFELAHWTFSSLVAWAAALFFIAIAL